MELAAFIVSIAAIIISVIVAILQGIHDSKINRITLESLYHQEIYKDYLINKIPIARRYLSFGNDGTLRDVEKMCSVLREMVYDSLYFLYSDRAFYATLREKCLELEDYLITLSQQPLSQRNQECAENEIQTRIKEIYNHIGRKYING